MNRTLNEDMEAIVKEYKIRIEKSISELADLDIDEKKEKLENVKEMISYYSNETSKVEDRRIKVGELSWQNLLIVGSAIGVLFLLDLPKFVQLFFLVLLIGIAIIQVLLIKEYYDQSSYSYPFKQIKDYSNKWKWFYYGNKWIQKISDDPTKCEATLIKDCENYLEGLVLFLNSYKNETLDSELMDDLQQLYLLQVHNYYKNRFYLRLLELARKSYSKLPIFIVVLIVILVIIYLVSYNHCPDFYSKFFM